MSTRPISATTVAQRKLSGERAEICEEVDELIFELTGRRDLRLTEGKGMTVINLLKIRDVLKIVKSKENA